ncbi:growth/differentiation factor 2 [Chanos chanos]|uniref:Growth/differentiation factor 2 n=1 Tax=Chanos chanos TaxID=29144 RepID=A0A6J2VD27_CHACN|nr:growth/differentiation factor 2-like [Chanos chanos]
MQSSRYLVLQFCLSLAVSVGSCTGKPLSDVTQWEYTEFLRMVEHDLEEGEEEEEDDEQEEELNFSLESFLGTMKKEFLRNLNLSGVPQEHSKINPPQFMVELYNKYASDKSSIPRSDVIRSFIIQDVTHSERNGNKTKHRLLFNISVPQHEEVTMMQLRLFTTWDSDIITCDEVIALINIYDVEYKLNQPTLHLLDGKELTETKSSWLAFDVTAAIQGWFHSGRSGGELEVEIEQPDCGFLKSGGCDVSLSLQDNTSAVLIVFSDDLESRKRELKKEMREMVLQEQGTRAPEERGALLGPDLKEDDSNQDPINHPRKKRHARKNYCRRTSLRVNFKDIGWDKWIVAPPEYDAYECKGVCYFPLTDEVSPSKHAIIQALVNLSNPKKANMACCVPTKLDPITVMYQENGVITVRHLYEEMKVAECGCR